MSGLFGQIIDILTSLPGNLAYHLVLAFAVAGALQAAHSHWRSDGSAASQRMVTGLGLILLARLAMFLAAGIAWQGLINEHLLLPPLDRAVTLLSIILVVWLWAFPQPMRLADAATVLLGLLTVTSLGLSLLWWQGSGAELEYNAAWPALGMEIAALVISLAGGLLVLLRRVSGWGPGLATLVILSAGHILFLLLPEAGGDYPGIVRLAQMIAFPILLTLPHRLSEHSVGLQPAVSVGEKYEPVRSDGGLMEALLSLGNDTDSKHVCQELTRIISQKFVSDLCLLVSPPDSHGRMTIQCGYDLIRELNLDGSSFNSRSIPVVVSSFRRGRVLYLPDSSTSPDLRGLGDILGLKRIGNLLATPILDQQNHLVAGIILLTPYSAKNWTSQDQELLVSIASPLAQLLHRNQTIAQLAAELAQVREALQIAQAEIQSALIEKQNLLARLSEAGRDNGGSQSQADSLAALIAAQEEAQDTIERLRKENEQLQEGQHVEVSGVERGQAGTGEGLFRDGAESKYLEGELRMALEEIAHLRSMLYEADVKLLALDRSSENKTGLDGLTLSSFAQQLRQPLASVLGYTDFLLGESVGILGTQQKKFLERIRGSSQRISVMIEDVSRANERIARRPVSPFEAVSLTQVIDSAVDQVRPQILEKSIALRVDLPKGLPRLRTDRAALQKILVSLLENANHVTPNSGEVTLRARLKGEPETQDYLLVQVADQGGSIPLGSSPEGVSPAATRVDQASASSAVRFEGLPMVKAMVENLSGRIWVDSEIGVGCTYSLLLPVSPKSSSDRGGGAAQ